MMTPHSIAVRVVTRLRELGLTVATAESCTGGLVAVYLTDIPGASAVYPGGFVTYTNEVKQASLGVRAETLAACTEIAAETACEMAAGARARLGTDIGLATTGIAGPGGGTEEHPVGTVYIALSAKAHVSVRRLSLGDIGRDAVRHAATEAILQELLDYLNKSDHT